MKNSPRTHVFCVCLTGSLSFRFCLTAFLSVCLCELSTPHVCLSMDQLYHLIIKALFFIRKYDKMRGEIDEPQVKSK